MSHFNTTPVQLSSHNCICQKEDNSYMLFNCHFDASCCPYVFARLFHQKWSWLYWYTHVNLLCNQIKLILFHHQKSIKKIKNLKKVLHYQDHKRWNRWCINLLKPSIICSKQANIKHLPSALMEAFSRITFEKCS